MSSKNNPKDNAPKKQSFLDSMFDINMDGKVDNWDFAEMAFIQDMIDEDEKEEAREEKRDRLVDLGLDPDEYDDDELDDLDI